MELRLNSRDSMNKLKDILFSSWEGKLLWVIFFIIILIIITTLSYLFYGSGTEYFNQTNGVSLSQNLQILNHSQIEVGTYTLGVEGIAKNIGNKQMGYAEIRVKFYDESDVLLETASDWIRDLNPNEEWQFEIYTQSSNIDHYQIAIGDCW